MLRGLKATSQPVADAGADSGPIPADAATNPCPTLTGTWTCGWITSGPVEETGQCCYGVAFSNCCGRPFVVGGAARTAPCEARSDWLGSERLTQSALSPELRSALAEAWLSDARLEHASIAAFARFALDLLAMGAPAELVGGAQSAMADEHRHARECFTLASGYAGIDIGPGPLDLTGALAGEGPLQVIATAIEEGCVGETIAALLAAEQAECAVDPEVRRVLDGIAADEARHAELSWKFVAWAVEAIAPAARASLMATFERALSRQAPRPDAPGLDMTEWRAHGRLGFADRARVVEHAKRDVILPCAMRLLEATRGGLRATVTRAPTPP